MGNNLIGHKVKLNQLNETGIALGYSSEFSEESKYTVSLDSSSKICRVTENRISSIEKVHNKVLYKRLLRDIDSPDILTKRYSSELICDFIEFESSSINFGLLKSGIETIISALEKEKDPDIGLKLAESIFEFIWLEKLVEEEMTNLIIRLAKLNSDHTYSYLDDEDYMSIPEVKSYIEGKDKEWIN